VVQGVGKHTLGDFYMGMGTGVDFWFREILEFGPMWWAIGCR
jgi:hypothetical protein